MKICRYRDANRLCILTVTVMVLLLITTMAHASDRRQLWQSRDQFVALEPQDVIPGETARTNNHPCEIAPDRLTAMLASIAFRSADSGKPEQLLTNQSLEVLVPHLVQGFRQATPGEDVTFAVIGLHKTMLGLAMSPTVTTGRAFYKEGRLNIIFGLVRQDFNEREDRRLAPFTPGNRHTAAAGEWTLQQQPGQNGFTLVRKDWVAFSDEWRAAVIHMPAAEQNPASIQTMPAQRGKQNIDTRSPAERLATLNELKNKGLITDEEYRGKRMEILNGL